MWSMNTHLVGGRELLEVLLGMRVPSILVRMYLVSILALGACLQWQSSHDRVYSSGVGNQCKARKRMHEGLHAHLPRSVVVRLLYLGI